MQNLFEKLEKNCSEVFLSKEFNDEYYYDGNDLGFTYTANKTTFKMWSPVAKCVSLNLYEKGDGDCLYRQIPMKKEEKGIWSVSVEEDIAGIYYTYSVTIDHVKTMDRINPDNVTYAYCKGAGMVTNETADVYAKSAGVNGIRSMVVDFEKTNPQNWNLDKKPQFDNMTDAVIYEMHVRDISSDESSGIKNKGKFIGLIEEGTRNVNGSSTGIDHMKELGITHVHLLPSFDYQSVDEAHPEKKEFNWGYDPQNYNLPEGSYSTDAYDGYVRIKEFKQMVKGFHDNGIRVIMDVVYNHTFTAYDSCFTKTVPNYYYRVDNNVNTNGSGCGNETASENLMFRKYMIDSCLYWAKEYHVDGFRFDLMAVHDIETMNEVSDAIKAYDPSIIIYGEGWVGGPSKLAWDDASFKDNGCKLRNIALFSDDIRDSIKGHVMESDDKGYANGGLIQKDGKKLDYMLNALKFGICGATSHPQVRTRNEEGWDLAPIFWANNPTQCITYNSVHDNWTLWDKIALSCENASFEDRVKMNKMAAAIIMTSQGIALIQAGEEMLRSKPIEGGYEENSYKSPDSVNSIKWNNKDQYKDVYEYYKGLIEFRKAHKALRLVDASDVASSIKFHECDEKKIIVYSIDAKNVNDICEEIYIIINGTLNDKEIELPDGQWKVCINGKSSGCDIIETVNDKIVSEAISVTVLIK